MHRLSYFCLLSLFVSSILACDTQADDWPHWMGPQHDGVWREKGIVKTLPKEGPKYKWRVPINKGYTGPAVVDGKLYVMDRVEKPAPADDDAAGKAKRGFPFRITPQ